jgi:hypothetical protein
MDRVVICAAPQSPGHQQNHLKFINYREKFDYYK